MARILGDETAILNHLAERNATNDAVKRPV